jgi:hypothetical protein
MYLSVARALRVLIEQVGLTEAANPEVTMPTRDRAAAHPISEPHFRSRIESLLPEAAVAQVVGLGRQAEQEAG